MTHVSWHTAAFSSVLLTCLILAIYFNVDGELVPNSLDGTFSTHTWHFKMYCISAGNEVHTKYDKRGPLSAIKGSH